MASNTCLALILIIVFSIEVALFRRMRWRLKLILILSLEKLHEFDGRRGRVQDPEPDSSRDRWMVQQCTLSKNMMADDKEHVYSDDTCPEFIQDLLPSAERTALLYHLSYLRLGKYPKLERLIRERALGTQLLFGSSEALLMKCVGTSENLITSLLPSLKLAVKKNKPQLAVKFLEKAKGWISDIIMDVKEFVKRYEKHNNITEKEETDTAQQLKQKQQTSEMEALQKIMDGLEVHLRKISKEIEDYEKKIEEKNSETQTFMSSITNTKGEKMIQMPDLPPEMGQGVAIFSMIAPFLDSVIDYISKMVTATSQKSVIKTLHDLLSELTRAQQRLKEEEWSIQNKMMDNQLKLAKLKTENGQMPSVTHLGEVQKSLSRIQQILVQLQKFWEKMGSLLDTLKEKTFAGEVWIEDLTDMKEQFLESIDAAQEEWTKFGISSMKANNIFSVQTSQAYRFLEISPSSLSEEEWQKEYESVKEKLQNIKPNSVCQPVTL